jgi:hypothetical protein
VLNGLNFGIAPDETCAPGLFSGIPGAGLDGRSPRQVSANKVNAAVSISRVQLKMNFSACMKPFTF